MPHPSSEVEPHRPVCGARVKRKPGHLCPNKPEPGRTRCRLHGGCSTGPLLEEGKQLSQAARKAGRAQWLQWIKATGQKAPCGRKPKAMAVLLARRKSLQQHINRVTTGSSNPSFITYKLVELEDAVTKANESAERHGQWRLYLLNKHKQERHERKQQELREQLARQYDITPHERRRREQDQLAHDIAVASGFYGDPNNTRR